MINFIRDTLNSIRERIRNPFTIRNATPFAGAFFIALVIYNWKLVFTLFNFDSSDDRLRKIEIISTFLKEKNWWYRIWNPTILAFGSIVFYYFFNNISLGITIFFNRWVRSFVLHFTDRGRLMPKDEFNNTMTEYNRLNKRFEDVNKEYAVLKGDQESLKAENQNQKIRLQELIEINEKSFKERAILIDDLKIKSNELQKVEETSKAIQVIYAEYGKNGIKKDVTEVVSNLLKNNSKFLVKNNELGLDPLKNVNKELSIVYTLFGKTHNLSVREFYEVGINNEGLLYANQTPQSKKVYSQKKGPRKIENIQDFFPGQWQLVYSGRLNGTEDVEIKEGNKYYTKAGNETSFRHTFNLSDIILDMGENKITFKKVGISPDVRIIDCSLNLIELGKEYQGTEESGAITVMYQFKE